MIQQQTYDFGKSCINLDSYEQKLLSQSKEYIRRNILYFTCVITFAIRTRLESGTKREMTILIMLCFVLPYVAYKHEIDQIRCVACSQCTMIYFVAFHFQVHNVSTLWLERTFWYNKKMCSFSIIFNWNKNQKGLHDSWHKKFSLKVRFWHFSTKFGGFLWAAF